MQWSPRPSETVALVAIGLGLGLALVFLDSAGRVLVGAGALLLLGLAARDLMARPRLTAGPDGVDVRTWTVVAIALARAARAGPGEPPARHAQPDAGAGHGVRSRRRRRPRGARPSRPGR